MKSNEAASRLTHKDERIRDLGSQLAEAQQYIQRLQGRLLQPHRGQAALRAVSAKRRPSDATAPQAAPPAVQERQDREDQANDAAAQGAQPLPPWNNGTKAKAQGQRRGASQPRGKAATAVAAALGPGGGQPLDIQPVARQLLPSYSVLAARHIKQKAKTSKAKPLYQSMDTAAILSLVDRDTSPALRRGDGHQQHAADLVDRGNRRATAAAQAGTPSAGQASNQPIMPLMAGSGGAALQQPARSPATLPAANLADGFHKVSTSVLPSNHQVLRPSGGGTSSPSMRIASSAGAAAPSSNFAMPTSLTASDLADMRKLTAGGGTLADMRSKVTASDGTSSHSLLEELQQMQSELRRVEQQMGQISQTHTPLALRQAAAHSADQARDAEGGLSPSEDHRWLQPQQAPPTLVPDSGETSSPQKDLFDSAEHAPVASAPGFPSKALEFAQASEAPSGSSPGTAHPNSEQAPQAPAPSFKILRVHRRPEAVEPQPSPRHVRAAMLAAVLPGPAPPSPARHPEAQAEFSDEETGSVTFGGQQSFSSPPSSTATSRPLQLNRFGASALAAQQQERAHFIPPQLESPPPSLQSLRYIASPYHQRPGDASSSQSLSPGQRVMPLSMTQVMSPQHHGRMRDVSPPFAFPTMQRHTHSSEKAAGHVPGRYLPPPSLNRAHQQLSDNWQGGFTGNQGSAYNESFYRPGEPASAPLLPAHLSNAVGDGSDVEASAHQSGDFSHDHAASAADPTYSPASVQKRRRSSESQEGNSHAADADVNGADADLQVGYQQLAFELEGDS